MGNQKLLPQINHPRSLKKLDISQLRQLAEEIRSLILDVTSAHPGHVGASLGVVELTLAIHYVFNTPDDSLIWDVGHQAYAHKIITGRRDAFSTNRQYKGISGFPKRNESPFDAFGTGHASTSLSAALGMAEASLIKGLRKKHIAVIGDGALTGGMALEALNNAGTSNADLLIILNDNGMSIDKNVGAISRQLRAQVSKNETKNQRWLDQMRELTETQSTFNSKFLQNHLFQAFNLDYYGPFDGHDLEALIPQMQLMKSMEHPRLLHVKTQKGKGFEQAENDNIRFHSPGYFDRQTGMVKKNPADHDDSPTYQKIFGEQLLHLAMNNQNIVAVTPAMPTGSYLQPMIRALPGRVFDVGIAEQHAVTFSAGLAAAGMKPFCVIYSTFLQRAIDQLIHDVALQNLDVVLMIDRAGLVGADGPTHHGVFDLSLLSCIPNIQLLAPADANELIAMMEWAAQNKGPIAIRYPKGKVPQEVYHESAAKPISSGQAVVKRKGRNLCLLSLGDPGFSMKGLTDQLAEEEIEIGHVDMRFLKPLDQDLLKKLAMDYAIWVSIEDGSLEGGLAAALGKFITGNNFNNRLLSFGIPDRFVEQGSRQELRQELGIDRKSVIKTIRNLLS